MRAQRYLIVPVTTTTGLYCEKSSERRIGHSEDEIQRLLGPTGASALHYVFGARYQRGNGMGSLFGDLLDRAMTFIKRGSVALGKEALNTGESIADDVMYGQKIKKAVKQHH